MHGIALAIIVAALLGPTKMGHRKAPTKTTPAAHVVMSTPDAGKAPAEKKKKRSAKARAHGPAVSGAAKEALVAEVAAAARVPKLVIKRMFELSVDRATDGIGFSLGALRLDRSYGSSERPRAVFERHSYIRMQVPTRVGASYLFDCGLSGVSSFDFSVWEGGGPNWSYGSVTPTADRVIFAHIAADDEPTMLTVNILATDGTKVFSFSGCEITELTPVVDHMQPGTDAGVLSE